MSTSDGAGRLDPALAIELQPSVVEALVDWQAATGYTFKLEEWLTGGQTRAKVAVVVLTGRTNISKLIVKFCPPDRLTAREPRLHAEALDNSPAAFKDEHLVEMPLKQLNPATNGVFCSRLSPVTRFATSVLWKVFCMTNTSQT